MRVEAIVAIKVAARELGCSEAEAVERRFLAQGSSTAERQIHNLEVAGSIPAPATNGAADSLAVAPKGSFTKDDLRALIAGGGVQTAPTLLDTPRAPFDVVVDGEPHRVSTSGKKLFLFYLGPVGPQPVRQLADGELETLWEKRTNQ